MTNSIHNNSNVVVAKFQQTKKNALNLPESIITMIFFDYVGIQPCDWKKTSLIDSTFNHMFNDPLNICVFFQKVIKIEPWQNLTPYFKLSERSNGGLKSLHIHLPYHTASYNSFIINMLSRNSIEYLTLKKVELYSDLIDAIFSKNLKDCSLIDTVIDDIDLLSDDRLSNCFKVNDPLS